MDKIIKKDIVNGVEYKYNGIGGGSSSTGEQHEVITQAAYDQLTPAQKAEKVYMITGEGGSGGGIIGEKIYEGNLTSTFIDIDFNINDYSLIVYQYGATNSNYHSGSFSPQYLPSGEIEINGTITFNSDRTQMAGNSSPQRLVLIGY